MAFKEIETLATIPKAEIAKAEKRVAEEIFARYGDRKLVLLEVLEGAGRFVEQIAEHLREMGSKVEHTTIRAISYRDTAPQPFTRIADPPSWHLLHKRPVIVLDDILDTGRTLATVGNFVTSKYHTRSIEVGALLAKKIPEWVNGDYVGFKIPEDAGFVVGYGMDYNGKFRDEDGIRLLTDEERRLYGTEKKE